MRLTSRLFVFFFLFSFFFFPHISNVHAQAALQWDKTKCACYFTTLVGTESAKTCEMVPIAAGSTQKACELTCKNKYQNALVEYKFGKNDEEASAVSAACTESFAQTKSALENDISAVVPKLEVKIPGLEFAPAQKSKTLFSSSFLSQYIAGLYQYLLGIGGMIALVMVLVGGLQYVLGAGAKAQIEKGKERMKNGVIGLILLLSVYLILQTVNPQLAILRNLEVSIPPRYELEDVLDQTAGDDKDPDGKIIEKLIGPIDPALGKCTKEAALATAKKLTELNVCVGPCHCAYTSSRFLKYIGCGNPTNGSAYYEALILDKGSKNRPGWVTELTPDGKSPYVGMAFMKGHAGVMLGDGLTFDSGASVTKKNPTCPGNFQDSLGRPEKCSSCAKIPEEAPVSGRFGAPALGGTSGAGTCQSNQEWSIRPNNWLVIVRPLQPGEADHERVCCELNETFKPRKWFITKTLCSVLKNEVSTESTDGNAPQFTEECTN